MSICYVIKNKEGKMLCWHYVSGYYFDHFNYRSLSYMEIGTEKEIKTTFNNKEFDNTECSIVPITIVEGDLNQQLAEKDKEIEKLKNFMSKWHFENFESFENHYNYLMSLKNREQLMVENEAMKETIANLLGQKKTSSKAIRKQVCNKVLELCDEKFRSINEFDFVEVISRDELIEVLDYIEGAE